MAELTRPTKRTQPPDPLFCLKGDMGIIHSLCFSNDSKQLLLASTEDGLVHFWSLDTNRRTHKQTMGKSIQTIHSIDDDLITQEKSGTVKLWTGNPSNYQFMKSSQTYGGFCKSIVVKNKLIIPDGNSSVTVIHIKSMDKIGSMSTDGRNFGNVMCLTSACIKNKEYILGAFETGDMLVWDLDSYNIVSQVKLIEQTTSISYDSSRNKGISANSSNILQTFRIDENSLEIIIDKEISITNDGVNVVKYSTNGKVFVAGCWDSRIRYFNSKSSKILAVLTEHKKPIGDVQFSPFLVSQWNSSIMAAGGQDGVISLWNMFM